MNRRKSHILLRKAEKLILSSDLYPIIPKGDISVEFIENVFKFNPFYIFNLIKQNAVDSLLLETDLLQEDCELDEIIDLAWQKQEKKQKTRILNALVSSSRTVFPDIEFEHTSYMSFRPAETDIIYRAYSIYYIATDINDISSLLFSYTILKSLDSFKFNGNKALISPGFERDKRVYEALMHAIKCEIAASYKKVSGE